MTGAVRTMDPAQAVTPAYTSCAVMRAMTLRLRSISFAISKSAPELLIFESENGKSVYGRAGLARRQSS